MSPETESYIAGLRLKAVSARAALAVAKETGVATVGYVRKQLERAEHYEEIVAVFEMTRNETLEEAAEEADLHGLGLMTNSAIGQSCASIAKRIRAKKVVTDVPDEENV